MNQAQEAAITRWAAKLGLARNVYLARLASGLKRCRKCAAWKPLDTFASDRSRRDGKNTVCRECHRVKEPRRHNFSDAERQALRERNKTGKWASGRLMSQEQRRNLSNHLKAIGRWVGQDSPAWKGGITPENKLLRESSDARMWRAAVLDRDGYACQDCGDSSGGNLQAHHIQGWADHPELRYCNDNGVTLCVSCHRKRHYKPDSIRNQRKSHRRAKLGQLSLFHC